MSNQRKAEETAAERIKMLSPLLEENQDRAALAEKKRKVCEKYGISDRTLRRYLLQYRKEGFAGLKPKQTGRPGLRSIPEEVLKEAIQLRREVPGRSVNTIIQILEWEKKIAPGSIKRSTLQEHLATAGYSSSQMRIYRDSPVAARRFQRSSRNSLWQSDIKFGPYINGKQVYLVAFIDDCTRFVLHAEFYPVLDATIVEDAYRQALTKYGAPKNVYFDNGKQYRTKVMERACAKLDIRLLFARPYSAESKGKIERFNRTIDGFLSEIKIEKPDTLKELNRRFWVWLDECYQHKPHSSLADNVSPAVAFNMDKEPLRFLDTEKIAEAFLRIEERKVDKSGCISFNGKKYEIENGLLLIGRKVNVIYERTAPEFLWIEHENFPKTTAKPLAIGERAGQRPPLPPLLGKENVTKSRLLEAAEKRNQNREKRRKSVISFRNIEGEDNV
ncbi:DDE-type integrase/transposase/recombinase [uncultured Aminobacterium sp.]|uniref:DDE-type integrase/transposase/recombinase n=1 Tax=uncultured Aminobacterium sp. TaxID=548265 RepID=UPI002598B4D6|nr:DDE-type integrase/transposase/recombinase [uncultured Aminobacterium sp.]